MIQKIQRLIALLALLAFAPTYSYGGGAHNIGEELGAQEHSLPYNVFQHRALAVATIGLTNMLQPLGMPFSHIPKLAALAHLGVVEGGSYHHMWRETENDSDKKLLILDRIGFACGIEYLLVELLCSMELLPKEPLSENWICHAVFLGVNLLLSSDWSRLESEFVEHQAEDLLPKPQVNPKKRTGKRANKKGHKKNRDRKK